MALIKLIELDLKFIKSLAEKPEGLAMRDILNVSKTKIDPVFVKRGNSILVMERPQFEAISAALKL